MPSVFAELRLRRVFAMAFAAILVGASAPADARLKRAPTDRWADPIETAERASIGAQLAYVRESGGGRHAFIATAFGRDDHAVDVGPGDSYPAAAMSDGSLVVIRAENQGERHRESLVRVDLRTRATSALGRATRIRNPSVAKSGAVVFESDALSFRDLFVVRPPRETEVRLTDNSEGNYEPSFFPDGDMIAFTSSRDGGAEIYTMSSDGRAPRRLTASFGDDMRPLVSPDGRAIAFISGRTGDDRIFVMGPNGEAQRPVRPGPAGESEREHAWSPDGQSLVFVARGRTDETAKSRIFLWDRSRDAVVQLTDGTSVCDMPVFSPDGRYIAFVSDKGGTPDLWLMRADGSGAVPLFERENASASAGAHGAQEKKRWLPVWVDTPKPVHRAEGVRRD